MPNDTSFTDADIKTCTKCGESKPLSMYSFRERKTGTLRNQCKPCVAEASAPIKKKYYQEHLDQYTSRARAWYADNTERAKANTKRWQAANNEKRNEYRRKRNQLLYSTDAIDEVDINGRIDMFGGKCWMCNADATTIDHVKPLSKGGRHMLANIRPACRSCNARKNNHWYGIDQLDKFIVAKPL